MNCKIADLIVEIPEAGDLVPRCKAYLCDSAVTPDIRIRTELFRMDVWPTKLDNSLKVYLESGIQFHVGLLEYCGMMLHASAVELDGKAYLFSGQSGMGKSTHTRLWKQYFGANAHVFNDDKPAIRCIDGIWYAYGTPWCGKDAININMKVPIAGVCFLEQAQYNAIRRLDTRESVQRVVFQTMRKFNKQKDLELMLSHVDKLVSQIPFFLMENRPELDAVQLSYETMLQAAKEQGL